MLGKIFQLKKDNQDLKSKAGKEKEAKKKDKKEKEKDEQIKKVRA